MLKKIIIGVFVFLIIAVFGAAWYFSSQLVYPPFRECPKKHFVYCDNPEELNLTFEDISFKSPDGKELKGWYIPSKNSKKVIILVHGHGASRYEGMRWAKALNKGGFNLLTFDLRNSGKSEKCYTSMGFHEKKDVIGAVDYIINEKKLTKIGVFGASMGGVSSIFAMAEDERIKAGTFEAAYAHLDDLLTEMASRDFGLPKYPLMPLVLKFWELRAHADAEKMNAEDVIGKISPRPVFIIHCPEDNFIPYSHGERNYQAAKEPKQLWSAGCNQHAEAWQSDPAKGEALVVNFFRKYIK